MEDSSQRLAAEDPASTKINNVLQFWYGDKDEWRGSLWFKGVLYEGLPGYSPSGVQSAQDARDVADTYIRDTFGDLFDELVDPATCTLNIPQQSPWMSTITGRVSLMTLLDQFSRNAFRGTARMFSYDELACRVAVGLLQDTAFHTLPLMHKLFVCVCLTHSEVLANVNSASVQLLALIGSMETETDLQLRPSRIHSHDATKDNSHDATKDKNRLPEKKPILVNRFKTVLKQTETHYKILLKLVLLGIFQISIMT